MLNEPFPWPRSVIEHHIALPVQKGLRILVADNVKQNVRVTLLEFDEERDDLLLHEPRHTADADISFQAV